MKKALIFFAAGCAGAMANSVALWALGEWGITRAAGIAIAPALTANWLYPRIVWGGIWGIVFALPLFNSKPIFKGSLLSLFPTIIQLFVVFPYKAQKGIAGIDLGALTPVLVLVVNWVWGVVTALMIRFAR